MLDKDIIKHIINKFGINISRYKKSKHDEIVSIEPKGTRIGSALLGVIIDPFLVNKNEISNDHTNHRESIEIANVFLELGYQVDIISKLRGVFIPKKKYTFYVNLRTNFKKVSKYLNEDCIKIVNLDTSHWSSNNHAAAKRVINLQNRRNTSLACIRYITPNYAIEHCDYATMYGNEFTIGTYEFAGKQIYKTNIPSHLKIDNPAHKDFEKIKNNYLWFGSSGFVHKGLDLVLEAFTEMPDKNLIVCGPVDEEQDFKKEFHKELYKTENIDTKGWIDIESPEFPEIIDNCVATVFPSCAEGCNGGVVTCMKAGIIPIVSQQSGLEIESDYGFLFENLSVEGIKAKVNKVSGLPVEIMAEMTHKAWKYANLTHTVEAFHENYKKAIIDITAKESINQRVSRAD